MIYLDNAATTLQKPPCVGKPCWMRWNMRAIRAAGRMSRPFTRPVSSTMPVRHLQHFSMQKVRLHCFHGQRDPGAQHGALRPRPPRRSCYHDVLRAQLGAAAALSPAGAGAEVSFVEVDDTGRLRYEQFEKFLRPNTRLVVVTHASNVTGNLTDLAFVSTFAKNTVLRLLLTRPRPRAHGPSTCRRWGWMFSASPDTRRCWVRRGPAGCMSALADHGPLVVGGTGIHSFDETHPSQMPTALEAGR